jgi:hypothetical protein
MGDTARKSAEVRYTAAIAERILQGLSAGRSLTSICADDGLPTESAVRYWVQRDYRGFAARYRRARMAGNTALATRRAAIIDRILDELLDGRTLRAICRDEGMPPYTTFLSWIAEDHARYDLARDLGYEAMLDKMIVIADDSSRDWRLNARGNKLILDREHIARCRLAINARRQRLAQAAPKPRGPKTPAVKPRRMAGRGKA